MGLGGSGGRWAQHGRGGGVDEGGGGKEKVGGVEGQPIDDETDDEDDEMAILFTCAPDEGTAAGSVWSDSGAISFRRFSWTSLLAGVDLDPERPGRSRVFRESLELRTSVVLLKLSTMYSR